jgi:alanine racemase
MEHYLTAEVSRAAVTHNLRCIRGRLPKGCRLCAVVKADAYGHHLAGLWPTVAAKADVLAVATLSEAAALRGMGYEGRLLTIIACGAQSGGDLLEGAIEAGRRGIELTITDAADVRALHRRAAVADLTLAVHVKIDTGMGRSGVLPADAPALVQAVREAPALRLAGVCTHFAASDEADKSYTKRQFATFTRTLAALGDLTGVLRHAANSAAVTDLPATALDMVRVGLAVYGYPSGDELADPLPLRPALRLTGPLVQARRLPAGAVCGYGRTCKLERPSRVGIIPFGYADGLPRSLSSRCAAMAGAALLPVLGRISMDQIIVDLTDAPEVSVGDRVTLISPDPSAPNSVMNLARLAGTIPYEITARLGRRIRYVMVDTFD